MIRSIFKYFPVVIIVMAFYAIIIIPGTFHKEVERTIQPANESQCFMAYRTGAFAVPEIVYWAELNDPTLFALPNYRYGFSGVTRYQLPPVHSDAPPTPLQIAFDLPPGIPPDPISAVRLPFKRVDTKVMGVRRRGEAMKEMVVAPKTVLWMWGDGTMIDMPPSLTAALVKMDFSTIKPARETQVDIIHMGGPLALVLYQSSGSPELDQAVLKTLGPILSAVERPAQEAPLRLLGKDLLYGRQRVRVEWRTMPELNREGG